MILLGRRPAVYVSIAMMTRRETHQWSSKPKAQDQQCVVQEYLTISYYRQISSEYENPPMLQIDDTNPPRTNPDSTVYERCEENPTCVHVLARVQQSHYFSASLCRNAFSTFVSRSSPCYSQPITCITTCKNIWGHTGLYPAPARRYCTMLGTSAHDRSREQTEKERESVNTRNC